MLAYGCIKLSVIAFYRRLFVTNRNTFFDILSKVMATVTFLWALAFLLIVIFPCKTAFYANWASDEVSLEHCSIGFTSEYGLAISDLILDLIIILMPLPLIWRLHLTTKRKIAVTGIIILGASAVGASVARMVLYIQILAGLTTDVIIDSNQGTTVGLWWSLMESGLALIAASLPSLSYILTHFNFQSAIRSVRSAISLQSMHSSQKTTKSSGSEVGEGSPYTEIQDNNSTASHGINLNKQSMDKGFMNKNIEEYALEEV